MFIINSVTFYVNSKIGKHIAIALECYDYFPYLNSLISTVIDASLKHNKPLDDGLFGMIYKPVANK